MGMNERIAISEESKVRVKGLNFGDPITNICAGEGNPRRHAYFVEYEMNLRKNRFGIIHTDYLVKCTDRKGNFWCTDINVIYGGHLPSSECELLFRPVWRANYE